MIRTEVIKNFLDDPDKWNNYISRLLTQPQNNFALNLFWDKTLHEEGVSVPNPILIHRVPDSVRQELTHEINLKLIERGIDDLQVDDMIFHLMTNGSWINWHRDIAEDREGAITVYLNTEWDIDRGGDFIYKTGDNQMQRLSPSFNTAMFIRGEVDHRTTPVIGHHLRKSLQVWLKKVDK